MLFGTMTTALLIRATGRRWGATVRLEEQIDKQRFDRGAVMADPVITGGFGLTKLQTIQCALAGQRCTIRPACRKFPGQHRQYRIVPELVVIDEILVADAKYPLHHH